MKELIVAWQDPDSRAWYPVARLGRISGQYYFVYTEGAKRAPNFQPFGSLRDVSAAYLSDEIFPLFANRLLPTSRPEYRDYIRWLGFGDEKPDELDVLARSGGTRATDKLEMFPCPSPDEHGRYTGYFFCHGLRYLLPEHIKRIGQLSPGQRFFVALDVQNRADPNALLLRTEDPVSLVGYCPRYLAAEFGDFVRAVGASEVRFSMHQVNDDAPYDLRLLCKIDSPWPEGHEACSLGDYRPLFDLNKLRVALESNVGRIRA